MATSSCRLSGPARRDVLRAGAYGLGLGVVGSLVIRGGPDVVNLSSSPNVVPHSFLARRRKW